MGRRPLLHDFSTLPAWASGNMPSRPRTTLQPQPFQAVSTQPTAVLSQTLEGCSLWHHLSPKQVFQRPAPACASGTVSGGASRAVAGTICVWLSLSCLPKAACCVLL